MNIKFFKYILLLGIILALGWYFFIKGHDYKITFETTQAPGIVYSTLTGWNNWEPTTNKVVKTISKRPFTNLSQELSISSDSLISIDWVIKRKNDSTTQVTALLTDKNHSFYQKLRVPFFKTDFVKCALSTLKHIKEGLIIHKSEYKLSHVSQSTIPKQYGVYMSLESSLHDKANQMIKHAGVLMQYIRENNIKISGDPFVEVTHWNLQEDTINFDFCFPISKQDSMPISKNIHIKALQEKPALKILFNGNYRVSDRAWFTLLDYAETNHIDIKNLPIEIFKNDPHSGESELTWEAEVYIPINK